MAGKTVEMEGEINVGACAQAVGIHVTLTRQVKVVTPGLAMASGQRWAPMPRQAPQPATAVSAAPKPPAPNTLTQEEIGRVVAARAEARRGNATQAPQPAANPVANTAPAPTASVAPARVPARAPTAATVRDPLVNNVISLLKAKLPEPQIMLMLKQRNRPLKLTGADRGELEDAGASEKLIEAMTNPASIALK